MTKYREIIRLASLNLSQTNIALSCGVSKKTVNKVLKAAREKGIVNVKSSAPCYENAAYLRRLL